MFRIFKHVFLVLFLFCPHRFPARNAPENATVTTTDWESADGAGSATWRDFVRLVDVGKGSHVSGISELKRYFCRFGYLRNDSVSSFTDVFDSDLELAISLYQSNLGLPVSGKLDQDTVTLITSPRCGVSDSHMVTTGSVRATKRFAYFDGQPRWVRDGPVRLTYAFSKTNTIGSLSPEAVKAAFERAFSRWSDVIPVSFTQAEDYYTADIKIGFYRGDHGDGMPFDGVLGVLAHSFSPENGRLHMDAAEKWTLDFRKTESRVAVDLESVATHEIGHVLGLAHSSVKTAVMYPSLAARTKKLELTVDDVEGVQSLYGSNPDFSFESLLESENSFNSARKSTLVPLTLPLVLLLAAFPLFFPP